MPVNMRTAFKVKIEKKRLATIHLLSSFLPYCDICISDWLLKQEKIKAGLDFVH